MTVTLSALLSQDQSAPLTAQREGRASFDALVSQRIPEKRRFVQIPQHLSVSLIRVAMDDVYEGCEDVVRNVTYRMRERMKRNATVRTVSRGIRGAERRASELRVHVALSRLSGSALGTESGEREAPSDFRGIYRHPYRRGGRYPCLPLSATRVLRFPCRADPTIARAPRATRASPLLSSLLSSPLLVRRPTPSPLDPSAPEWRTTPP